VICNGDPCFSLYLCIVFLLFSQTQIWRKHNLTHVKNGCRMCTNMLVWLSGHRKNGPNQTSLLVVHHTPTLTSYYVMKFHELTWKKVLFWEFTHHQKWSESKLHFKQNKYEVYFCMYCSKGPVHKIQSFLQSVLKSLLATVVLFSCKCRRCCILCWWCRLAHFLCRLSQHFFWSCM